MRLQLAALVVALVALSSVVEGRVALAQDEQGWRVSSDTLLYTDTDNVLVISPQIAVHRTTDEDGGSASARVVVDAVSAASVDVVSQATKRFSEVRTELDLGFSKSVGSLLPSASYRFSHEPDYDLPRLWRRHSARPAKPRHHAGAGLRHFLRHGGLHGNPQEHLLRVSALPRVGGEPHPGVESQNTHPRRLHAQLQNGYMEKPYRFVPLFDQAAIDQAASDGVKLDLSNFDQYRLPLRPSEEVPDQRVGHAVGLRTQRYLEGLPGAVHLDYQFFVDSWGVQAHTLEPRLYWKYSDRINLAAYARFYLQSAADFWRREYVVVPGEVPGYRTMDRDLSDYYAITGGTRFEWKGTRLAGYVDASAMETVYTDYLFLTSRLALIAQVGARLQF